MLKFTPHPNPKPLTKQFTGLFCSAESPRGRNTTFLLEILRFAQYDECDLKYSHRKSSHCERKRSNPADYIICYLVLNVILRDMQVGFLNTSRQFYPKNLLRRLIKSNPLPNPLPKERGIACSSPKERLTLLVKIHPSSYPQTSHKTIHWIVLLGRVPKGKEFIVYIPRREFQLNSLRG